MGRLRIWMGAACFAAACGGATNRPHSGIIATREMPAPLLSRFEQPRTTTARPAEERDSMTEPPKPPPPIPSAQTTQPKHDEVASPRESLGPPPPPPPTATLPDDVVLGLLETGRVAFVYCFKKAIVDDPTELAFKIRLHVELDAAGVLTSARTDSTSKVLDTCLVHMAARLKYPASGKVVAVELPLFYQGP